MARMRPETIRLLTVCEDATVYKHKDALPFATISSGTDVDGAIVTRRMHVCFALQHCLRVLFALCDKSLARHTKKWQPKDSVTAMPSVPRKLCPMHHTLVG